MSQDLIVKNKGGRPTLYREEFCDQVEEHMSKGYSKESCAGLLGISKQCLYEWIQKHEKFGDSIKSGEEKSRLVWEKMGIEGMWAGKAFNPNVWIFNMKNRFRHEWRDNHDITTDGEKIATMADFVRAASNEQEADS